MEHPELKQRLLDPSYTVPEEGWGYYDQCYGSEETLHHLIAMQIKAMAERGEITTIVEVFDKAYGVGSKAHKDKGTINNVFSLWGHPVRREILVTNKVSTLEVYQIFRNTLKNELKAFARQQNRHWHDQDINAKTQQTLAYLYEKYPQKTRQLAKQLQEIGLSLPTLIKRAISTHLLS